jgi:hypothetical protein
VKKNIKESHFKAAAFELDHCPAMSGRRSIFINLYGNSYGVAAYSKSTARRLSSQLRLAAAWVDKVWKK